MSAIRVLEVNEVDLGGRSFNGYDMINDISNDQLIIKQAVIAKKSENTNVVKILQSYKVLDNYFKLLSYEDNSLSLHSTLSLSSPSLRNLKEYKEADIIHFHMFHNTKLSLYSLIKISKEKKIIFTLHDPWFLTGRCVHFYDCMKWQKGCTHCEHLNTMFSMPKDNSNYLWNVKKHIFDNINCDIVVTSKWMENLVKKSPIFENQHNIHFIPFGINLTRFKPTDGLKERKLFNIKKDNFVIFTRAQNEFKGTKYVLEALKMLNTEKNITIITCDGKNLLDDVKEKYQIVDLGVITEKVIIDAMNACNLFLMPSKAESFGMMALEAMACEKPVVVFNNSALPSVTFAPECGYLVEDKDSKGLANAINHFINNPEDIIIRGKKGRNLCEEFYNIDVYNKKIQDLYLETYKKINKELPLNDFFKENLEVQKMRILLNELTCYLFDDNNIRKKLLYDVPFIKIENVDYSNISVQMLIDEYNNKLFELLKTDD